MTRRTFASAAAGLSLPPLSFAQPAGRKGRIKQSVSRWCFQKYSLDELCRQAVRLGLKGIDLIGSKDWPTVQ